MKAKSEEAETSVLVRILSAVFYAVASIWIMFVNKIVLTNYQFPSYLAVGIGQMLATIVVLDILRLFRVITFAEFSWSIPKKIFPLPALYVLNLMTGLGGTQKLNLPMFTVMRRFSILMTLIGEYFVLGIVAKRSVKFSVFLMILGAIIAAVNDLTFDTFGYSLVLMNDFCTAANGVYMKQKLNAKDLGEYGLLYYNALFMLPFAVSFAIYTGDIEKAISYSNWSDFLFVVLFAFSCVCGFVM